MSDYNDIKNHFRDNPDVEIAEGRGAQGLKHANKMFVMFYKGNLTVKLKPENVAKIIAEGRGLPHDPGTGKPMKDRVLIPASKKDSWIEMCEQSLQEVKKGI
jgi:hypothetical protein